MATFPSLSSLEHAFARLAPRERLLVEIAAGLVAVLLVGGFLYEVGAVQSGLESRIRAKESQLREIQGLRNAFLEIRRATEAVTSHDPNRSTNWLYSALEPLVVKTVSRERLSKMAPSSKAIGDQYVEDSVEIVLSGITLQQATALLYEIESFPTPLRVSRLQMRKRANDPHQFEVTVAVSSLKAAEAAG